MPHSNARSPDAWRPLAAFVIAVLRQDAGRTRRAIATARRLGLPRRALEEAALMLVPHAGVPAALAALQALAAGWPARARRTREGGRRLWRRRGQALFERVYGEVTPRLERTLDTLHPHVRAWVVEEGYGRVLSRPGLGARERELMAIAILAVLGWERPLVSHLLGAVRLGAPERERRAALAVGLRGADAIHTARAHHAWEAAAAARSVRSPRARTQSASTRARG